MVLPSPFGQFGLIREGKSLNKRSFFVDSYTKTETGFKPAFLYFKI